MILPQIAIYGQFFLGKDPMPNLYIKSIFDRQKLLGSKDFYFPVSLLKKEFLRITFLYLK